MLGTNKGAEHQIQSDARSTSCYRSCESCPSCACVLLSVCLCGLVHSFPYVWFFRFFFFWCSTVLKSLHHLYTTLYHTPFPMLLRHLFPLLSFTLWQTLLDQPLPTHWLTLSLLTTLAWTVIMIALLVWQGQAIQLWVERTSLYFALSLVLYTSSVV